MEEFIKIRQKEIEGSESAIVKEDMQSYTMEHSRQDSEALNGRKKLIGEVIKGGVSTKVGKLKADRDKALLAMEILKSIIPGIPEGVTIVSGMCAGAVITEPPRPAVLRRR